MERLIVKNFGSIRDTDITFGDLTLFLGPNAGGKGILLQLIKLIIDKDNIPAVLHLNNYDWGRDKDKLLELFWGRQINLISILSRYPENVINP